MSHMEDLLHIKQLVKNGDLLEIEHYVDDAIAAIPKPNCVCGKPHLVSLVHRTDGPCYVREFKQ